MRNMVRRLPFLDFATLADRRLYAPGPVVRIAPNRYSFNTLEALRTIYSSTGGGFAKSDWYAAAGHPDKPNILNMQDSRLHTEKKRKIVSLYTMSTMVNYEGAVDKMNVVLMRKLREFAKTKRLVQLPVFLQYYAFDVIGYITVCPLIELSKTKSVSNSVTDG